MPDSTSTEKGKSSFWTTLPGILTGLAAIVTAIAALIGGLVQAGYFRHPTSAQHATESKKEDAAVNQGRSDSGRPANSQRPAVDESGTRGPRDIAFTATASAGEAVYQILSARVEDFGVDPLTQTRTLLLRLRVRVTNEGKYPSLFAPGGFRLLIDGVSRAPKDAPSKAVDANASEDGEMSFLVPENAQRLILRVGYSDDARVDIPLKFNLK